MYYMGIEDRLGIPVNQRSASGTAQSVALKDAEHRTSSSDFALFSDFHCVFHESLLPTLPLHLPPAATVADMVWCVLN